MAVTVELYGIARLRAGQSCVRLPLDGPIPLGAVVTMLANAFPELAAECFEGDRLRSGYLASVDGERFVTEASTQIADRATVLIMSSDVGG